MSHISFAENKWLEILHRERTEVVFISYYDVIPVFDKYARVFHTFIKYLFKFRDDSKQIVTDHLPYKQVSQFLENHGVSLFQTDRESYQIDTADSIFRNMVSPWKLMINPKLHTYQRYLFDILQHCVLNEAFQDTKTNRKVRGTILDAIAAVSGVAGNFDKQLEVENSIRRIYREITTDGSVYMRKWEELSRDKGIPPNPEIMRKLSEEVSKECRYLIFKNKQLPNPLNEIVAKIPEVAERMGEDDFTADTFLTDLYYGQSQKEGHRYEEFVDTRFFETNKYFIFLRSIIGEANNSNTQRLLKSKLMSSISTFNKCCIIFDLGGLGEELGNQCFPQDDKVGRSRNPTKSVNMFRTTLDALVRTDNAPKAVVQALCNVLLETKNIFGDAEELKERDENANFQSPIPNFVPDTPMSQMPTPKLRPQSPSQDELEQAFVGSIPSTPYTPLKIEEPSASHLTPISEARGFASFGRQFDTPDTPVEEDDFGVTAYSPEPQRHDVERTMNNERVAEAQNDTSGYLPIIALLGIGGFLILALHKRK